MSIEEKLLSLGFAYNAKGNVLSKRVLRESQIPIGCFFKSLETGVEFYSQNPEDDTKWDHLIMTRDFEEVLLDETVTAQSILEL
jgi:hypothetical protein